jgi:HEAT repeat protein
VTRRDIQKRRGYQQYDGRWRLSQEIALLEKEKAVEQSEKRWLVQLRTWREMLATEDSRQAYRLISAVRDPHSVNALTILLGEEPYRQIKLLYVEVLAEIGTPAALETLFHATLYDADIEIFHASLDEIVRLQPPHISRQFVEKLKDQENTCVNRAAHALGRLNDKSVLSPLIDALTTTHYVVIPKQTDNYTSTFASPGPGMAPGASPLGGTSFSAGGETKVIPNRLNNQEVLEALIKLSGGVNFGFDSQAWRYWLANENKNAAAGSDLRRSRGSGVSIDP